MDILAKVKFEGVGGYKMKVRTVKLAGSTKCKYNYKYKYKYYQETNIAVGSSVYVGLGEGIYRGPWGSEYRRQKMAIKNR